MKIKVDNFNLKEILNSGQCFRAIEESDQSFTIILSDRVINIKQEADELIISSSDNNSLKEVVYNYFDLNRDYTKINKYLSNIGLKDLVDKCKNYRILNQDSFEMSISYIISQNNNVKRITNSVNKISEKYGKKIIFNNKEYYLFPKYDEIKNVTYDDLKEFGVGFREKYIIDFLNKYEYLKDIKNLSTEDAINELMKVKGIGLKVASCILLFGYKRLDVFPIDTWVRQYISQNYNIKNNVKDIKLFSNDKFGKYSGLVIQYMFHSQRNLKN